MRSRQASWRLSFARIAVRLLLGNDPIRQQGPPKGGVGVAPCSQRPGPPLWCHLHGPGRDHREQGREQRLGQNSPSRRPDIPPGCPLHLSSTKGFNASGSARWPYASTARQISASKGAPAPLNGYRQQVDLGRKATLVRRSQHSARAER